MTPEMLGDQQRVCKVQLNVSHTKQNVPLSSYALSDVAVPEKKKMKILTDNK